MLSSDESAYLAAAKNSPGIIPKVVNAMPTHLCQTNYVGNVGKRREGSGSLHPNDVSHAIANRGT